MNGSTGQERNGLNAFWIDSLCFFFSLSWKQDVKGGMQVWKWEGEKFLFWFYEMISLLSQSSSQDVIRGKNLISKVSSFLKFLTVLYWKLLKKKMLRLHLVNLVILYQNLIIYISHFFKRQIYKVAVVSCCWIDDGWMKSMRCCFFFFVRISHFRRGIMLE